MANATKTDEARLDPIVEDETRRGYRVKSLPAELPAKLEEYGLNPFSHIRMTKLNPARRRKITELVQRAYHRDLKDVDLLSNSQVLALVADRGEWTPQTETRLAELKERTTAQLAGLYHEGVEHSKEWLASLRELIETFIGDVDASEKSTEDKAEILRRFSRWHQYRPERQAFYAEKYAEELSTGVYYPDSDLSWLMDQAPTLASADALDDIGELNDKIWRYLVLVHEREEYETLRLTRLRIFANTIESRRDNAEEMARAYFTTERCDEDGNPQGPLALSFEGLYEFPDEVISWLVEEQFFFHANIPDEVREYVGAFGFLTAETAKGETAPQTPIAALPGSPEQSAASPEVQPLSTASPQ